MHVATENSIQFWHKMLTTYKDPSSTSEPVTFLPSAVVKVFPKSDTTSPTTVGMQRLRTKEIKKGKILFY